MTLPYWRPWRRREFGQENAKRTGSQAPRVFPWMLEDLDEARTEHILHPVPEQVRATYRDQWLGAYRQLDRWGVSLGGEDRGRS
jgi:hypothetical protein